MATWKPYQFDTNPAGYIPPEPPQVGDPPVYYDDNDAAWIVLPLSEVNPALLSNGKYYVGVDSLDLESESWRASAPYPIPFVIVNKS